MKHIKNGELVHIIHLPFDIIYLMIDILAAYLNCGKLIWIIKEWVFLLHYFSLLTLAIKEVENHINKLKVKVKSTTFKHIEQRAIFWFWMFKCVSLSDWIWLEFVSNAHVLIYFSRMYQGQFLVKISSTIVMRILKWLKLLIFLWVLLYTKNAAFNDFILSLFWVKSYIGLLLFCEKYKYVEFWR